MSHAGEPACLRASTYPFSELLEKTAIWKQPTGVDKLSFGEGGGQSTADSLETELLAQIPLDAAIREGCDREYPS